MNERVRELLANALDNETVIASKSFGHWPLYDEDLEKFAELIVKECVQVCADRGNHHDGLYSAWASDCSERIEKHFGVKP